MQTVVNNERSILVRDGYESCREHVLRGTCARSSVTKVLARGPVNRCSPTMQMVYRLTAGIICSFADSPAFQRFYGVPWVRRSVSPDIGA
jgi:hypothetical protein